jgi:hypothetical protein
MAAPLGAYTSAPAASIIATYNPLSGGGQPGYPPPGAAPVAMSDNVVTTNRPGAFSSVVRPVV